MRADGLASILFDAVCSTRNLAVSKLRVCTDAIGFCTCVLSEYPVVCTLRRQVRTIYGTIMYIVY